MQTVKQIYNVVMCLQPDMQDCADNENMMHWIGYGEQLDDLLFIADTDGVDGVIDQINHIMGTRLSSKPEHHACTDVATTLESVYPSDYAGKFKY